MGHSAPQLLHNRVGAEGCWTRHPWRRRNVSQRAVLQDPLSILCFCISMIPLHSKLGKKIKLHKYITYDPGSDSFAELLFGVFHSWHIVLFITVCQCDSSIILLFTVLPFSSAVKMKRKSMPLKRIMANSPSARSVLIYLVFFWTLISECTRMDDMKVWT